MDLDLSSYDIPACAQFMTGRDVTRHADLFVVAYLSTDNRALVAHLLTVASDLMAASQALIGLFLTDGYDPDRDTQEGLTEAQRFNVLTLASTCAYNATLFVQEAQHRRVQRAVTGWDPITAPVTA